MKGHPRVRERAARAPRVLHVIPSFNGGGAERVLLTLLSRLPEISQALAVSWAGSLVPLVPPGVPVLRVRTAGDLARLMARWRPDVVHTWLDDSLVLATPPAVHLGIPLVHRVYNVPSVQKRYEPGGAWHNESMARGLHAAARVIALSPTAADDAARFYGIARPTVIYNGFPLAGRRGVRRRRISKPAGRFVVLNVARLEPQKGHAHLIDAFHRLARKHCEIELWLAGVGPLEGALRRQAAAAGVAARVKFLGFQEDVTALHAAADVFVFPSIFEGFGNALGEALAAGLPVVATDLPVIRRDVLGGEPGALLVPAADALALAEALDRLVSDRAARATLAAQARRAGARFPVARMLDEYRAIYRGVTEETRAAA
jgi:glycosyltransferase involved in cell wall biosynthesis